MSGYCRGCGNTLCICKLINSNVSIEEHHKTYEQLYFESLKIISEAQKQLKEANDVIEYYLPILEERLSCGAYARNYLTKYKVKE